MCARIVLEHGKESCAGRGGKGGRRAEGEGGKRLPENSMQSLRTSLRQRLAQSFGFRRDDKLVSRETQGIVLVQGCRMLPRKGINCSHGFLQGSGGGV